MIVTGDRRGRRVGALAGLLLGALAVLLGPAAPASAHAALDRTSPAANAVLATAPAEVVLTFTEPVRAVPDKIRVIGPDGRRADQGKPVVSGPVVTIPLRTTAPRGTYLVSYRVVSADSHPLAGGYTYSVGAPSAPPSATADGAADPLVTALIAVAKYLGYAGLVLMIGPALVLALLWPRRLARRRPTRLVWTGAALIAVGALAGLWLQAPYTTGGSLASVSAGDLRDVLSSPFGTAQIVRLAVLAASVLLLRPVLAGRGGRVDAALLVILGATGLATWPLGGHPGASPVPPVSVVADVVHLAGMAVWLGGLVMLVGFLLRRADERELDAILPIWSRWAALAVSALLLAGIVQALIEVRTPHALVSTTYGRLVLAKVGLLALVLAVAAYSRRLVQRRAAASQPGSMRRAVRSELVITAVVLALAAVLTQTTPARTAAAQSALSAPTLYSATLRSPLYLLQVELDPAKTGDNSVHLYAYTPDNKPLPVVEWKATAALPDKGIEPIDIPLLKITDNHAIGEVALPAVGAWKFSFTVRISEIDQATVTTTVAVP
jgi:copper transport protein